MRGERFKIPGVMGRELGTAADRHGGDHAIREAARAAAGLVEKACGEHGIGGQEGLGLRENLAGECLAGGVHRPAEELRPRNGADVQDFLLTNAGGELRVCD